MTEQGYMTIRIGMSEPYMTLRADPQPVPNEEAEDVTAYQDRLQAGEYAGDGPEHEQPETTDAAAAKAAELGVNLGAVKGSGKDGKVTVGDVEAAAKASAAPAEPEAEPSE